MAAWLNKGRTAANLSSTCFIWSCLNSTGWSDVMCPGGDACRRTSAVRDLQTGQGSGGKPRTGITRHTGCREVPLCRTISLTTWDRHLRVFGGCDQVNEDHKEKLGRTVIRSGERGRDRVYIRGRPTRGGARTPFITQCSLESLYRPSCTPSSWHMHLDMVLHGSLGYFRGTGTYGRKKGLLNRTVPDNEVLERGVHDEKSNDAESCHGS